MSESLFQAVLTPSIVDTPEEVDQYLRKHVGVTLETIRSALRVGLSEAAMATEHSAATSYGFRMWDGTMRELRDRLAKRGWQTARPGQLEAVRRGDQKLQILAAMGDAGVCDRSATPSAAHPRGTSTYVAIQSNQLSFGDIAPDNKREDWEPIQSWWLLYRPSPAEPGQLRAELSLPVAMYGQTITGWAVRIFLPTEAGGNSSKRKQMPKPANPIQVAVERKTA
jgi:hypothetical protein